MRTNLTTQPDNTLTWRSHPVRQHPERLPTLILVLFIGAACVWLLFSRPLPVAVAVTLLLSSVSEYLIPTAYRLTAEGVTSRGPQGLLILSWQQTRRCLQSPSGLILTPLPTSSRLDRFRGVLLRYAPDGEPGDRASVLAAILHFAPELYVPCQSKHGAKNGIFGDTPIEGGQLEGGQSDAGL